jgi:hypothetical protein
MPNNQRKEGYTMLIEITYNEVLSDIFIKGGVVFPCFAIALYRTLAASMCPCLSRKKFYYLFCLLTIILYSLLMPFDEGIGVVVVALLMFVPCIVLGMIEMSRKWRWYVVLLSCIVEQALFPFWFYIVFTIALIIEGGD